MITTAQGSATRTPAPALPQATAEPMWVRVLLTTVALLFLALFLAAPLFIVFSQALSEGFGLYLESLTNPDALARPGTGLGLAIVDRIVRRHSGHVEVSSELGRGTTVVVTLPARDADVVSREPAPSS